MVEKINVTEDQVEPPLTWKTFPYYGFVTILAVNIIIYILMLFDGVAFFEPGSDDLLRWGANFGPYTLKNEWWRLFTCEFVHIGIAHLFANIVALLYVGILLEPLIGTLRFVTIYLLATVAAALVSLWWHPYEIGAGASGAVLAMYGMMLMFSVVGRKMFAPGELSFFFIWAIFVIGFNLLTGLKDGVDNSAHIGGILYGMFAALVFYPSYRKKESLSITFLNDLVLIAVSIGIFAFAYNQLPKGLAYYDDKMEQFDYNQEIALTLMKQYDADTVAYEKGDYYLPRFRKEGVEVWERTITSLSELNHLPKDYGTRVDLFLKYASLRKRSCEVIIRSFEDSTGYPQNELRPLYDSMDVVVKDIDRITYIIDHGLPPELDTLTIAPGIKVNDIKLDE